MTALGGSKSKAGWYNSAVMEALRNQSAPLRALIGIAEAFAALIRSRNIDQLDPWLRRAQESSAPVLRRFAEKLLAGYEACGQCHSPKLANHQNWPRSKLSRHNFMREAHKALSA